MVCKGIEGNNSCMDGKQKIRNVDSIDYLCWEEHKKLIDLWLENSVSDAYQSIVLSYIDGLRDRHQQAQMIDRQIQLTFKRESKYFIIDSMMSERKRVYKRFNEYLTELDCKFNQEEHQDELNLKEISQMLTDLRKFQMLISENIFQMFKQYSLKKYSLGGQYTEIFNLFDRDMQILKQTFLRYYIPLSEQFDPLLLQPAKYIKIMYREQSLIYNEDIEGLFAINPSYMFRLLRAKKNMMEIIVIPEKEEKVVEKPPALGRKEIRKQNKVGSGPKTESNSKATLDNRIYLESFPSSKPQKQKKQKNNQNPPSFDPESQVRTETQLPKPRFISPQKNQNVVREMSRKRRFLTETPAIESFHRRKKMKQESQECCSSPLKKSLNYISSIIKIDIGSQIKRKRKKSELTLNGSELNYPTDCTKKIQKKVEKQPKIYINNQTEDEYVSHLESRHLTINKNTENNTKKQSYKLYLGEDSKQARKKTIYFSQSDITTKDGKKAMNIERLVSKPEGKMKEKRSREIGREVLEEKRKKMIQSIEEKYRLLAEKEKDEELEKLNKSVEFKSVQRPTKQVLLKHKFNSNKHQKGL